MDSQKKQQFMLTFVRSRRTGWPRRSATFTPGVNWYGCSKGLMAESYAAAAHRCHSGLGAPDFLQQLTAERLEALDRDLRL
jgi:hypothetical protein